ncbi:MAG: transporter permease [Rickettsiales bacterium]|jgi:microcin C transport system permease protein|nr:transporter permease [Rickettsiales bacterium]
MPYDTGLIASPTIKPFTYCCDPIYSLLKTALGSVKDMTAYLIRRLLLMIPTLFGIMVINFAIVQAAPGGPVEQLIAQLSGNAVNATARFSSGGGEVIGTSNTPMQQQGEGGSSQYRGSQGLDPDLIKDIEKLYGFDKPPTERFFQMIWQYVHFDFGTSFFRDATVIDLIAEKLPVSISLGLWTTLFVYLLSIPLGIRKAVRDGSAFDTWTSTIIIVGYAIPSFLFAVLLIIVFAGGSYWNIFPMRGLVSPEWSSMSWPDKIIDYFWHLTLPVISMIIGGFASLTMLCKNSFLDEIHKQYVLTARAKGLSEHKVLYGHVFRNAMLIVIAGFPGALLHILFTSSLLIEVIFSLDGLGLLGFESAVHRDYPVIFGTLFIFTLLGLIMHLVSDLVYTWVDPRIDFERRG